MVAVVLQRTEQAAEVVVALQVVVRMAQERQEPQAAS